MRRLYLHIGYWFVYLLQAELLIYLLYVTRYEIPPGEAFRNSLTGNITLLIPKILLTYYIAKLIFGKNNAEPNSLAKNIFHILLAVFVSLIIYRALVFYVILSSFHYNKSNQYFFDPLSFLTALMDIGFAVGTASAIKQYRLNVRIKENEKNLLRSKLENELQFLRSQMNPHFLFNTLNNIYGLSLRNAPETPDVLMKLSNLLRFMLYETEKESVPISTEIKMIDDYIELEKLRYSKRLKLEFIKEIDNDTREISPLLLLNFVENAFKHGTSETKGEVRIQIFLKLSNGILTFSIENTKDQNDEENIDRKIGLVNVKRQLELLYSEHTLEIASEPAVFKVYLKINLQTHAKIFLPDNRR